MSLQDLTLILRSLAPAAGAADAAVGRGECPATPLTFERDNPDSRHPFLHLFNPHRLRRRRPRKDSRPLFLDDPFSWTTSDLTPMSFPLWSSCRGSSLKITQEAVQLRLSVYLHEVRWQFQLPNLSRPMRVQRHHPSAAHGHHGVE